MNCSSYKISHHTLEHSYRFKCIYDIFYTNYYFTDILDVYILFSSGSYIIADYMASCHINRKLEKLNLIFFLTQERR